MRKNRMKEILRQGGVAIGCQVRTRSPLVAELYGLCGLDFAFIENEHYMYDPESIEEVIRGCQMTEITPLVRIPNADPSQIMQILDAGAGGLIIPHINDSASALAAYRASKFAPVGNRGFSNSCRATNFGLMPLAPYLQEANKETLLVAMIESKEAVAKLEDILDTGIECIHIGPMDLSESFGFSGSQEHAKVRDAVDYILRVAGKRGIPVGWPAASIEEANVMIKKGVRMVSFSSDLALLSRSVRDALAQIDH